MKRNSRRFVRRQNQPNERSHSPFFNLAHDESKQHPSFFQTQLKTGEKGDKYEKEANNAAGKIANKVPSSPEPAVQKQDISAVQMSSMKENEEKIAQKQEKEEEPKPVQKATSEDDKKPVQKMSDEKDKPVQKATSEDDKKPVQKMSDEKDKPVQKADVDEKKEVQSKHEEEKKDEHPPIMHKKKEGNGTEKSSDISERIKETKGKGQPMSEKTARQMEQAFGADFSKVNIHTDEQSASLNKDMHSIAFTNGADIYFAEGQYNPDSSSEKTLLAHELTHVIQQTGK